MVISGSSKIDLFPLFNLCCIDTLQFRNFCLETTSNVEMYFHSLNLRNFCLVSHPAGRFSQFHPNLPRRQQKGCTTLKSECLLLLKLGGKFPEKELKTHQARTNSRRGGREEHSLFSLRVAEMALKNAMFIGQPHTK